MIKYIYLYKNILSTLWIEINLSVTITRSYNAIIKKLTINARDSGFFNFHGIGNYSIHDIGIFNLKVYFVPCLTRYSMGG